MVRFWLVGEWVWAKRDISNHNRRMLNNVTPNDERVLYRKNCIIINYAAGKSLYIKNMFESTTEKLDSDHAVKYCLIEDGVPLTYAKVLNLWQFDRSFRSYFTSLLANSSFSAYRWETPPISDHSITRYFEFVLLNSPEFISRSTDSKAYSAYFTRDDIDCGIVTFGNLSRDATLIVPSPRGANNTYGHLAAFIRHAPESQVDALWRVVGTTVANRVSPVPLWLSTAGGGVAWLHIRLDSRPKYYGFIPYKNAV
jgi:hypothetical protein